MRRKEFTVGNEQEVEEFLREMTFGFLGTIGDDGYPHITPLNFVYADGNFYMHGSKIGQKMSDLKQHSKVTFTVAKEYGIIPSYWSDPVLACPATAFFKSVVARGEASIVEDPAEKAAALSAFMEKLQPEGGYEPIRADHPKYKPQIAGVAVIKIAVKEMTAKFKFGQNFPKAKAEHIMTGLGERDRDLDAETIELMKKYCPHHNRQTD
ncbi:pyridoxamine 5'-phosphate oxidase family protein [Paenibacillus thermotolerans]|uniref:pyridoxamine 5'-phosphate oxidase family protein n=1 Tax=Paenibacillus thermotolerans TaxID=3027807 RepID=UPI002367F108|nr:MULTISPECIES: pyridoxamine 5'-phosphate oxidase family protein [unclassified Paenibacillus]